MKKALIILSCAVILQACNTNPASNKSVDAAKTVEAKPSNLDIEAIKKQITIQKGMENNDAPDNQVHFLDQKDVELSLSIIDEGLAQAGYKKPDKADFEKKIKEIYICENNDNAEWKGTGLERNLTSASWKSEANFINYYSDNYGETERRHYRMVAFGKHNFVFDLDFLKSLITIEPDGKYKITLPHNIVARNRYFFNNNKADLNYLVNKDKEFLTTLVAVFGYDKEPEINGAALSEYNTGTKDDENIGFIVFDDFSKSEKVIIRKGLLKYIYDHTTGTNNHMVKELSNFVFNFSDPNDYSLVSFENKCKMLAYAGTLEHQLRDKYIAEDISKWDPNSLLANFKVQWPNFIDEIKKENYYDDAEIKKAVTEAEQEAYQLTLKPDPE